MRSARPGSIHSATFAALTCMLVAIGACSTNEEPRPVDVSVSALCTGVQVSWSPAGNTVSGTVALSATNTTCGTGQTPEYQFLYRREGTGSAYTLLSGWSPSSTFSWNTNTFPSGLYTVVADARVAGTTVTRDSRATATVLVGDVCPSVALTLSPTGTLPPGTPIAATASATCTGGTAQYRFLYRAVGSSVFNEVQAWSPNAVLNWNTSAQVPGVHTLQVQTRSGTNLVSESQRNVSYTLGQTCSSLAFSASPAGNSAVGATVALSGSATCTGGALPEFQYSYRLTGASTWTVVRAWGTGATHNWSTTGIAAGSYQLRAEVRANDYAGAAQASRTLNHTIGGLCGTVTLSTSPASPQPLGTAVTLTGNATCASGTPQYRFSMLAPGASTDTVLRDWNATATYTLTTAATLSGSYILKVEARAVGAPAVQATATRTYMLGGVCNAVAFSVQSPSPQPVGSSVPLLASATCTGGAGAEYQYGYRRGTSGAFTILGGWSTNAAKTWDTTSLLTGTYQLRAEVRAQGNQGPSEANQILSFALVCPTGYVDNGQGICADQDECASGLTECDPVACVNTAGSYTCTCPAGTLDVHGDGTECSDVAVEQLASGGRCAITVAGKLYCWGYNLFGQLGIGSNSDSSLPVQVGTANDWEDISAGENYTCGIRSGALYCWGHNVHGTLGTGDNVNTNVPTRVGTASDWDDVATGQSHACGTRSGALYCWGNNDSGELGVGHTNDTSTPARVGTATDWSTVTAGRSLTCGTRAGSLYCWGNNDFGQVGNGSAPTDASTPQRVGTATNWDIVVAGDNHTCGLRAGNLFCWGSGASGKLGLGTITSQSVPVQVGPAVGWDSVAVGFGHTCAILNGALYCWGSGMSGQTGTGALVDSLNPTRVGTDTDWDQVEGGTCGTRNGTLYCWGSNMYGELANGTTSHVTTPVQSGSASDWSHVAAGYKHGCGIRAGALYCWGYKYDGLGDGMSVISDVPLRVGTATDWASVDAGGTHTGSHTCAIRAGRLYCWGRNSQGQLGDGTNTDSTVPVQVGIASDWSSVTTGSSGSTCGTRAGALYCWGRNFDGQLGIGTTGNTNVPLRVGSAADWQQVSIAVQHTCGIRAGQLYCWGRSSSGALGLGDTMSFTTTPLRVGTASDWASISTGRSHSCGVRAGTLHCWGSNFEGQAGGDLAYFVPTQLGTATNWVSVGLGLDHSCGIRAGQLYCWGQGENGELGDGARLNTSTPVLASSATDWSAVTGGEWHTCGLRTGRLYCWGASGSGQLGNDDILKAPDLPVVFP